ncbi:MAG: hypothetical protein ACFCUR_02395 [Rhodomicrobiaceae bacterium]
MMTMPPLDHDDPDWIEIISEGNDLDLYLFVSKSVFPKNGDFIGPRSKPIHDHPDRFQ